MPELKDALRSYISETIERVNAEDLAIDPIVPRGAPRRSVLRRPFPVFATSAIVTMLLIGGVALVLTRWPGGTPSTMTSPAVTAPPTGAAWMPESVALPSQESIVDMTVLPSGGFAAVTTNPDRVVWSPEGVDWFDIDPQHRAAPYQAVSDLPPPHERLAGEAGGWIVILDRANLGVWAGSPDTGEWNPIWFDASNFDGRTDLLTLSTNPLDALVVARTVVATEIDDEGEPRERYRYLVWVVNPETATAKEHTLPISVTPEHSEYSYAIATWYLDRWVLAVTGGSDGSSLLSSPDGKSWTESSWPFSEPPDYWGSLMSVSAGPAGIVALVCYWGGDSFWHSTDGIEWTQTGSGLGHASAYVDGVGFLAGTGGIEWVSIDGLEWRSPSQIGVGFERVDATTKTDAGPFVFGDELWTWFSTDSAEAQ